jgi:tetratricopeptide (TPR) repeat protein
MTLAAARQRVDPFRGGPRATAADYEAALREARRVLANAPLREDARYLAAYAQGGLDYLAHKDDAAKAALSEGLAATRRMPFAHDGRLLTAFLRRSEERGAISGWELALAFGDARGEAEGLLASEIAKSPQDPAPLFGRALLRHMQGKDEAALSDAAGAAGLARGGRGTAAIADFLGETNIRLGRPEEALRWYRAAMDTPNGGKPERAFAAYRAALLLRDDLHRQAEAAELFQKACDGGNAQACLESGGTARPRGLRRRLAR